MKPKDLCLVKISKRLLACLLIVIPVAAAAQTLEFNFANPVTLAATETPGDWYPDRYVPCGFVSPVKGPGNTKNVLQQSVCANDYQTPTPSFYNTQGRKYDLIANTYSITISVYVPISWKKTNARMAGFWATASNSSNVVGNDYPIMEFQGPITSDAGGPGYYPNGGVAGFYGWDNTANGGNGGFTLIGLPAGFQYNTWVELTMTLVPNKGFVYTVTGANGKGVSLKTGFYDPAEASLANVILEAYNYGSPYNIDWNDLSFSFTSLVCSK
jgi:hypothetical protein